MTQERKNTPTEDAFLKAKELDAIVGFYLNRKAEMHDRTNTDICDFVTCEKYQIQFSSAAAMIIGALQKYMK
jgi:hypothetical protein